MSHRGRKLAFLLLYVSFVYLLFELFYSALYVWGIISPPPSLWIFEDRGTIQFDAIRGYRLSAVPSRWSRITYGEVEYLGTLRGNAQGFPDDRDFTPARMESERTRIAVFGDSFTAAQFLLRNWPATVEELAEKAGMPLELLNFSIDGGGLANWWSVLTNVVEADDYQVDGLLFAPIDSDLMRTFTVAEHRNQRRHSLGRTPSWEPAEWPKTPAEAQRYLLPTDGYLVSPEEFDRTLSGDLRPDIERPWALYGARAVLDLLTRAQLRLRHALRPRPSPRGRLVPAKAPQRTEFQPSQQRLVEQIADFARRRSIPILVVRIPLREELLQGRPPSERMLRFASLLGATFVDGSEAFAGLSESEIRSSWFRYDGHWAQTGSDRFASFILGVLKDWTERFPRRREERPTS